MLNDAQKIGIVNYKLNERIRNHFKNNFDEIREIKTPYGELGELLYHIFDSPNFWLDIITNEKVALKPYTELKNCDEFYTEWRRVDVRLQDYLANKKEAIDYSRKIHVSFGPDEEFNTSVEELLMHISHHSFYHRGMVGALVRMHNLPPLPTSNWFFMI